MLAQAASPPADMVSSAPSSSSAMSHTKCPAEPTPSNPEHTCSTHAPPPPPSSKLKCVHCASVLYGPFCGQCGSDSLDSYTMLRPLLAKRSVEATAAELDRLQTLSDFVFADQRPTLSSPDRMARSDEENERRVSFYKYAYASRVDAKGRRRWARAAVAG